MKDINEVFISELDNINVKIVSGGHYKQVLNYIFDSLQASIPCERISIALLTGEILTTHWLRTKFPINYINVGYSASIKGSTLEQVVRTGKPRIINDLVEYKKQHHYSKSTELAIMEGIQSSLTCSLISQGQCVGIIFFSSKDKNTYTQKHIETINVLAHSLAVVVEQGRLQKFYDDNQNKTKMYSMVTHDLRSPIGVIMGFLDLIFEEKWYSQLSDADREKFLVIKKNCNSMLELVNDLSDSVQLSGNHVKFDFTEVNVHSFITDIIQSAKIFASHKNISVTDNLSKANAIVARFDPSRMRQVIDNLISNAIKFSNQNTKIEVNVRVEDETLVIAIKDQGPGIPDNEISKLFSEYGKTSVRPTGGETSTGLGLSIVKKIVERHQGTVAVKSKLNEGTTFEIVIPLAR